MCSEHRALSSLFGSWGVRFRAEGRCQQPAARGDTCQEHPSRGSFMTSGEPGAWVQGGGQVLHYLHLCCAVSTAPNTFYYLCHHPQTCGKPLPGAHSFYFSAVTVLLWERGYPHKVTYTIQQLLCSEPSRQHRHKQDYTGSETHIKK